MIDRGNATLASKQIPEFTSREEEAAFWESHDFTEFWDDLEPGQLRVSPEFRQRVLDRISSESTPFDGQPRLLSITIDSADQAMIEACARERGLHPATLVQAWIDDRIEQEERERASPTS